MPNGMSISNTCYSYAVVPSTAKIKWSLPINNTVIQYFHRNIKETDFKPSNDALGTLNTLKQIFACYRLKCESIYNRFIIFFKCKSGSKIILNFLWILE